MDSFGERALCFGERKPKLGRFERANFNRALGANDRELPPRAAKGIVVIAANRRESIWIAEGGNLIVLEAIVLGSESDGCHFHRFP